MQTLSQETQGGYPADAARPSRMQARADGPVNGKTMVPVLPHDVVHQLAADFAKLLARFDALTVAVQALAVEVNSIKQNNPPPLLDTEKEGQGVRHQRKRYHELAEGQKGEPTTHGRRVLRA